MKFIGLDIGGANTDCVIIEFDKKFNLINIRQDKYYLPFWSEHAKLPECINHLIGKDKIDVACVSITAELADCYSTKREGIIDITNMVHDTLKDSILKFVTFNGLKDYKYVQENPLSAAAANWIGTLESIKHIKDTCIFMDMGTTTTDIIPIKDGININTGFSDTERLASGELVYTGLLRSNLTSLARKVPVNGVMTRISSELFAITADIHNILGHISEAEYTCNTPDGKDKDVQSSKIRLAHLVCGDIETINDDNLILIAEYLYHKQIQEVEDALSQVISKTGINNIILSDIGNGSVCKKAAENLGCEIFNLNDYISQSLISIITAVGAIQMYIDKYINADINILKCVYKSNFY